MEFNNREAAKTGHPKQLLLWGKPPLNPMPRLKAAMREAINKSSLSREQVAIAMNEIAASEGLTCGGRGQKVTETMLDKWVAAGADEHKIPISYLCIFCYVVGSNLPLQALASPLEAMVITGDDITILRWGKTELERRKLSKTAAKLAQEVGIR